VSKLRVTHVSLALAQISCLVQISAFYFVSFYFISFQFYRVLRFLRATAYNASRVLSIVIYKCLSVCLSVRPSHPDTVSKQRHLELQNLHCGCHKDFSLWRQNFASLSERGREIGAPPLKCAYFTAIDSYSVKTVTDEHKHAVYHNKHW